MFGNLFSKRGKPLPNVFVKTPLTQKFRNQAVFVISQVVEPLTQENFHSGLLENRIYIAAEKAVCEEHGIFNLLNKNDANIRRGRIENVPHSIMVNEDEDIVLDLIELVICYCLYDASRGHLEKSDVEDAITKLNYRFRENGLAYEYDKTAGQLICIENMVTHSEAIKPTIELLAAKHYSNANKEFLTALEDYKKGDYNDCLAKCCSAFESVMKIICTKKKWTHATKTLEKLAANDLIELILSKTGLLPNIYQAPLVNIATIRNKLSSAHGAGPTARKPEDYEARYALNATASAILLIHEATQAS